MCADTSLGAQLLGRIKEYDMTWVIIRTHMGTQYWECTLASSHKSVNMHIFKTYMHCSFEIECSTVGKKVEWKHKLRYARVNVQKGEKPKSYLQNCMHESVSFLFLISFRVIFKRKSIAFNPFYRFSLFTSFYPDPPPVLLSLQADL